MGRAKYAKTAKRGRGTERGRRGSATIKDARAPLFKAFDKALLGLCVCRGAREKLPGDKVRGHVCAWVGWSGLAWASC